MFISKELVFVELHKTGGSHIGYILDRVLDGEQVGKHNMVPPHLYDKFVLGSIRDPWDWYVSLWGYGCDGKGSVRRRVLAGVDGRYYYRELNKDFGMRWLSPGHYITQILHDLRKPRSLWSDSYSKEDAPASFRRWLKMLLNSERKFDIGEGYGFSPISMHSGLLTFRFFKLFTDLGPSIYQDSGLGTVESLPRIWRDHRIVDYIVRSEDLELGLVEAFEKAGIELSEQSLTLIRQAKNSKTNVSSRRETSFYYDEETVELVNESEAFIINEFGYSQPNFI